MMSCRIASGLGRECCSSDQKRVCQTFSELPFHCVCIGNVLASGLNVSLPPPNVAREGLGNWLSWQARPRWCSVMTTAIQAFLCLLPANRNIKA